MNWIADGVCMFKHKAIDGPKRDNRKKSDNVSVISKTRLETIAEKEIFKDFKQEWSWQNIPIHFLIAVMLIEGSIQICYKAKKEKIKVVDR